MKKLANILMVLLITVALSACGGSGGGTEEITGTGTGTGTGTNTGTNTGTIITTQATITDNTASQIVMDVIVGTRTGNTQASAADSSTSGAMALTTLSDDIIARAAITSDSMTINETFNGGCGGTMTMNGSIGTDILDVTISQANYCVGGMTYSGEQTMSGTPTNFSLTTSGATVRSDKINLTWRGQVDIVSSGFNDSMTQISSTATMNVDMTNNTANRLGRYENFVITSTITPPTVEQTFSGKFYDSVNGYVTVTTIEPLYYPSMTPINGDIYPSRGVVQVTGTDSSKALVAFSENFVHQIQADTDGDGLADFDSGPLDPYTSIENANSTDQEIYNISWPPSATLIKFSSGANSINYPSNTIEQDFRGHWWRIDAKANENYGIYVGTNGAYAGNPGDLACNITARDAQGENVFIDQREADILEGAPTGCVAYIEPTEDSTYYFAITGQRDLAGGSSTGNYSLTVQREYSGVYASDFSAGSTSSIRSFVGSFQFYKDLDVHKIYLPAGVYDITYETISQGESYAPSLNPTNTSIKFGIGDTQMLSANAADIKWTFASDYPLTLGYSWNPIISPGYYYVAVEANYHPATDLSFYKDWSIPITYKINITKTDTAYTANDTPTDSAQTAESWDQSLYGGTLESVMGLSSSTFLYTPDPSPPNGGVLSNDNTTSAAVNLQFRSGCIY